MGGFVNRLKYLLGEDAFKKDPIGVLARLVWWRGITALGSKAVCVPLAGYDTSILVPSEWRGIAKLIFAYRELYDRELVWLAHNVTTGATMVDVGANFGIYSIVAAKSVGPSGTVLSFEPAAQAFSFLEKNVYLNRLTNVRMFKCALGDHEDEVPLYHHPDPSRNSLRVTEGMSGTSEFVHVTTLERVCRQAGVVKIDLMKIDVEGSEEIVLGGCLPVLERVKPRLIIEINPPRAAMMGLAADGAWRTLEGLGYRLHRIANDGYLAPVISLPDHPENLIAVPGA